MKARQAVLAVLVAFLFGVFIARLPATLAFYRGDADWARALLETEQIIRARYVDPIDQQVLLNGAIDGMVRSLDDRYSEFIPPAQREGFEKALTGKFSGIGATVNIIDGVLTIISPIEDSPAFDAGLMAGDRIERIDNEPTLGLSVDRCVAKLVGDAGTSVALTISRGSGTFERVLTRRQVTARAVRGFRFLPAESRHDGKPGWDYLIDADRGLAYIRLSQFTPSIAAEFAAAFADAQAQSAGAGKPLSALILDLRDNGGGVLEQAVELADMFLASGTIVSTRGRDGSGETLIASPDVLIPVDVPILLMQNQASASASEVLAGALLDNRRAVVLGTRSFGKGLVQAIEPIFSIPGAQLKLTEQRYYLPSGRLLHRTDDAKEWGVDPSPGMLVALNAEQARQLGLNRRVFEAIQRVGAGQTPATSADGVLDARSAKWSDPAWLGEVLGDVQLSAAVKKVSERLSAGAWPASESTLDAKQMQEGAIASAELDRLQATYDVILLELARIERRIAAIDGGGESRITARPASLWPDDATVRGGRLEVFDQAGRQLAVLRILRDDLERWLIDADVRPVVPQASGDGAPAKVSGAEAPAP
jgi:carboxyl-terminal processing protease